MIKPISRLNKLLLNPRKPVSLMAPYFRLLVAVTLTAITASAQVELSSWYTDRSSTYARLFRSNNAQSNGNAITTWSRGDGVQEDPTYAGVQEIAYTSEWVYIKTTGLGTHTMGPWYRDEADSQNFANFPSNVSITYRIPREATIPTSKTETSSGAIGYFVDGVALYDGTDTYSYSNSDGEDGSPTSSIEGRGDGVWNRDAYINEGVTFDNAYAHQAGNEYHYHVNPIALRAALGDSVDYTSSTNTYTENFNGEHSPIIGWVADGLPIYGPYGYDDPNDANSTVRRMISGYQHRDGTNGSTNLNSTGRQSLPQWVSDIQGRSTSLSSSEYGPDVDSDYPIGHYLEDYTYKGDLGLTYGDDFDLNEYNVRFCVTPEYPSGTWAYFTNIESDGTPTFPYNIGVAFYGSPTASNASVPSNATVYFQGGGLKDEDADDATINSSSDQVTITWSVIEGGTYSVESSQDESTWTQIETFTAESEEATTTDASFSANSDGNAFYRLSRTALADFDDAFSTGAGSLTSEFIATINTQSGLEDDSSDDNSSDDSSSNDNSSDNSSGDDSSSDDSTTDEPIVDSPLDEGDIEEEDVEGNWHSIDGFGVYYSTADSWIYHLELGWLYVGSVEGSGVWLYTEELDWFWTSMDGVYPYVWLESSEEYSYIYVDDDTRYIYSFTSASWSIF